MSATSRNREKIKQLGYLLSGALGLLLLCFGLLGWNTPTLQAAGAILRVPDDYPTIQQAIDAAYPGDTIQVVGRDDVSEYKQYDENLVITKSLTLIGNLDLNYAVIDTIATINASNSGRAVTIFTDTEEVEVTFRGFAFENGDASGLGGATPISGFDPGLFAGPPPSYSPYLTGPVIAATAPDIQTMVNELRGYLDRLNQQGQMPGGAVGYAETVARMEWLNGNGLQAVEALAGVPVLDETLRPAAREQAAADGVDCGGGFYSRGAAVFLDNVVVDSNVASTSGSGYGGGICIVEAPADSVRITGATIGANTASSVSDGHGGGAFLQMAPGAVVSASKFVENRASAASEGYGGGLVVDRSPGVLVEYQTTFGANIASLAGPGFGGGAYVKASSAVTFSNVSFLGNIGAAGPVDPDDPDQVTGMGGGLIVSEADHLLITESCSFNANVASNAGPGDGGAVAVSDSDGVVIEVAVFERNIAAHGPGHGYGGAVALENATNSKLTQN